MKSVKPDVTALLLVSAGDKGGAFLLLLLLLYRAEKRRKNFTSGLSQIYTLGHRTYVIPGKIPKLRLKALASLFVEFTLSGKGNHQDAFRSLTF